MFLLVYIDDIIVASSSLAAIIDPLRDLNGLRPLHYFLGIEVHRTSDRIHLSQAKYTTDILNRAGMSSCKGVTTLLPSNSKLSVQDGESLGPEDVTKYRSMVGALQYLTLTRPNTSFQSIRFVSSFIHWQRLLSRLLNGFFDFSSTPFTSSSHSSLSVYYGQCLLRCGLG
jgi:hypothetical protein